MIDDDSSPIPNEPPQSIKNVVSIYQDIFNWIWSTTLIEHKIELKKDIVVNQKPYSIPYAYREEVKSMMAVMLKEGIIEPSSSEWCSPIVVKKKDGLLRIAIDYRKLNSITRFDAYPTPKINEIINGLHNAKIFSNSNIGF